MPDWPPENDATEPAPSTPQQQDRSQSDETSTSGQKPSRRSPSYSRRLDENSWKCQICEHENTDLSQNICAVCGSAPSDTSSPPRELEDNISEPFIPITDNDDLDAIQALTSTALMASLRSTVDSVSTRLGSIAAANEEEIDFMSDPLGPRDHEEYGHVSKEKSAMDLWTTSMDDEPPIFTDDHSDSASVLRMTSRHFEEVEEGGRSYKDIDENAQSPIYNTDVKDVDIFEEDEEESKKMLHWNRIRLIRILVCFLVWLVVILSIALIPDWNSDTDRDIDEGIRVSPSPTLSPPPSTSISPSFMPSEIPTLAPSFIPSTIPSSSPTLNPTILTPSPVTTNFNPSAILLGDDNASRFGETVILDHTGSFMAAMNGGGFVSIYRFMANGWEAFSVLDIGDTLNPATSFDMIAFKGIPIVAMTSRGYTRILEFDSESNIWIERPNINWETSDVVSPVVALSANGNSISTAHLERDGREIVVQVWEWSGVIWIPKGNSVRRQAEKNSFLSISLEMSGDANVFIVGGWSISIPQVQVKGYQWNGSFWQSHGSTPSFLWGPPDIALTNDGNCMAITTPTPGTTRIFHWNRGDGDWELLGQELGGGSSIDLSDDGMRTLVGSALASTAIVYDFINSNWEVVDTMTGNVGDQFSASVAMDAIGNTLVIGAPLDDFVATNAGKAIIFA